MRLLPARVHRAGLRLTIHLTALFPGVSQLPNVAIGPRPPGSGHNEWIETMYFDDHCGRTFPVDGGRDMSCNHRFDIRGCHRF
jgi:hypothetical protein